MKEIGCREKIHKEESFIVIVVVLKMKDDILAA